MQRANYADVRAGALPACSCRGVYLPWLATAAMSWTSLAGREHVQTRAWRHRAGWSPWHYSVSTVLATFALITADPSTTAAIPSIMWFCCTGASSIRCGSNCPGKECLNGQRRVNGMERMEWTEWKEGMNGMEWNGMDQEMEWNMDEWKTTEWNGE